VSAEEDNRGSPHGGGAHANRSPGEVDRWLRSALERAPEIVKVVDAGGTLRYASPAFGRVLGYDPGEAVGRMNVFDHVHPDDLPYVLGEAGKALSGDGGGAVEYRFRHKDGPWRWMEGAGTPLTDDPAVRRVVVSARDVTARKEAEEALRASEAFVRGLLRGLPSGSVSVFDEELRYLLAEGRGLGEAGLSPEMLVGRTVREVFGDEGLGLVEGHYRRAFSGEEVRFELPVGGEVYEISAAPLDADGGGGVRTIIAVAHNVTERKRAEEALRESERRLASVVSNAHAYAYRCLNEPGWPNEYASDYALELTGYPPEDLLVGGRVRLGDLIVEGDRERVWEEVQEALAKGRSFEVEYALRRRDGQIRHVRDYGHGVLGKDGGVEALEGLVYDITERRALEDRLMHQALHDPLTGLPNRRLLVDRLGQALGRTRRRKGRRVAVLFMDLDNFKGVNDSLGHGAGDLLLAAAAERLKGRLRPEDTLARFGGDEFAVIVENVGDPDEAVRVAGRISDGLGEPFVLGGRELYARASIGIALGSAPDKTPEDLLRDADTAMYKAKEDGVTFGVFDPSMHERAVGRLELENDLRRAVERDEFVVRYQPIVRLDGGGVCAVEALVRWEHPQRGLLNPGEFVPAAEEGGQIVPMGKRVLLEACRAGRRWHERHPRMPPLVVSVNLSARQLARPDLAETVERTLMETGLGARSLSLDVTETAYVRALEGNTGALGRLREMGVGVSIDDFGTGYSSLAYLKRLPADAVKIDRSFVAGLGEDVEDTAIVGTVIDLAHTFGMEAVAEGVETEGQARLLEEMGCDMAQGFHFARPLPPEKVLGFLAGQPPQG
jgi:diguanylate cyclase (GGDEF)-like protein/PAS domain S-box-containing protein